MLNIKQNTKEWLQFRKDKVGSSDAPIIMGDSPWSTPHKLWLEKLGLGKPRETTRAMQWGIDQEQTARDLFRIHTEIEITPTVLQHPSISWMIASMDGVSAEKNIGVEIKCPGTADHESAKKCIVPSKYYAQLQHQHAVGEFDKLFYASLGKDETFVFFEVPRDDQYIAQLTEKERAFYECVNNFESPALGEKDFEVRGDNEFSLAAQGWLEVRQKLKQLEALEKDLKDDLLSLAGGKPVKGCGIKISSCVRKGVIDHSLLPTDLSVKIEKYRKPPTSHWRIIQDDS